MRRHSLVGDVARKPNNSDPNGRYSDGPARREDEIAVGTVVDISGEERVFELLDSFLKFFGTIGKVPMSRHCG